MLHIESADWRGGHRLELSFDNGESKTVDVFPLLDGPIFQPLHDIDHFAQVSIDPIARTVVWPNGADLAPEALYALSPVAIAERPEGLRK